MRGTKVAVRVAAAVALLAPLLAVGDTLSVALGDAVCITGTIRDRTVGRFLLSVPLPEPVLESRIDFVKLEFPAFLSDTGPAVSILTHDCLTAWQAERVTWTTPWRRPGGDFDSVARSRYVALPGDSNPVVLDITEAARGWQQGRGRHGLLLVRPDAEGGGFQGERVRLRDVLRAARVKYYFTRVQN